MSKKTIHLLCNAHIDPVWLWEWEEGAAAAISTFRTAADLCEEFDGFIFNHNEVTLYQWVEEYEPALFERIRRLVRQGRWHIMGGWYLQPDCNMPSGEAMVRQILQTRVADGQFEECDLSTRDISRIRETLVESLTASFHTRLQYPWQKEAEEKKKE